ncbi:Scr1 family TA system antitoxin-like transcriptional regulator [Streptomyces uncialis]|uniref:Scr1 family TA system antitoxin-like transcriptional regulator n=1 Tax=Streptomyces uncialis TaxID=1048205 RepID=UPI0037FD2285
MHHIVFCGCVRLRACWFDREGMDTPIPGGLPRFSSITYSVPTAGSSRLYALVRSEGFAAKFKRWTTFEPDALAISEWSPTVVPGWLQTPSYAREIFRVANPRAAADEIRALVRARMTCQEFFRRACPPEF